MCVVEVKNRRHSDGRLSTTGKERFCHEGRTRGSLCDYVECQQTGPAIVPEKMISRPRPRFLAADIVTVTKDGKQRRYHHVGRSGRKRSPLVESGYDSTEQSADAASPLRMSPLIREVRPLASGEDPSHRCSNNALDSDMEESRSRSFGHSANFNPSSSVEMPQVGNTTQPLGSTATSGTCMLSSVQRSSHRRSRPKPIIVDIGASMTSTSSSRNTSSPGLSNLPPLVFRRDSPHDLPRRQAISRFQARADFLAGDDELDTQHFQDECNSQDQKAKDCLETSERYQQEQITRDLEAQELNQARLVCESMAETERRQAARRRLQVAAQDKEQAWSEAQKPSESERRQQESLNQQRKAREERCEKERLGEMKRSRADQKAETGARTTALEETQRKLHHRQETFAALERAAHENANHKRGVDAKVARERPAFDTRFLSHPPSPFTHQQQQQFYHHQHHQQPRSMPASPQRFTYTRTTSPISARQITTTRHVNPSPHHDHHDHDHHHHRPISAKYPSAVHNFYPSSSSGSQRNSLIERGAAVVAGEQMKATHFSTQRMEEREFRGDGMGVVIDARTYQSNGRGQTRDQREWVSGHGRGQM